MSEHYLIGLQLPADLQLHGYIMCDDVSETVAVVEKAIAFIEGKGVQFLPIILQTKLDKEGARFVRSLLRKYPEAKETLKNSKGFHYTFWLMSNNHADGVRLWEMH